MNTEKIIAIVIYLFFASEISYASSDIRDKVYDEAFNEEYKELLTNIRDNSKSYSIFGYKWMDSAFNLGIIAATYGMELKSPITEAFRHTKPRILTTKKNVCKLIADETNAISDGQFSRDFGYNELSIAADNLGFSVAKDFSRIFNKSVIELNSDKITKDILINFTKKPAGIIKDATKFTFIFGLVSEISPICDCYIGFTNKTINNKCLKDPNAGKFKRYNR